MLRSSLRTTLQRQATERAHRSIEEKAIDQYFRVSQAKKLKL